MSKANLGWLYYKDMYSQGDNKVQIEASLKQMFQASATDESFQSLQSFQLTTTYPGLIVGSGYTHGLKNDEDSKIGFYFDHTSGLPVIPGSSVKGVLRSLFGCDKNEYYAKEKQGFIQKLLSKDDTFDVKKLVDDMFEGKDEKGESKSIYKKDKFYEARIVKNRGAILAEDYLAPHKETFKNPILIKFIKVPGGTTFEFTFELQDGGGLSAKEKLELLFLLLQYSGVGAKTNVGYGQFEEKELAGMYTDLKMKEQVLEDILKEEEKDKEAQKVKEELKDATEEKRLFLENKDDLVPLIKQLENGEIAEEIKVPLAKLIKEELQKTDKNWNKAKQKTLKRKEIIEDILGE